MNTIRFPFAMLVIFAGCSFIDEGPEWVQEISTNRSMFTFEGPSIVITASYRNNTDFGVTLAPCDDSELIVLQKLVRGSFRTVYESVCQAFGRIPTVIAPGDSLVLVLMLSDDPRVYPKLAADRPGVYRLVAPNARDGLGRPGELQSNRFRIQG